MNIYLNAETPGVSLRYQIYDTKRTLNLDVKVEKVIAPETIEWKVNTIFQLVLEDQSKKEYSNDWIIEPWLHLDFQSADPDYFVPDYPDALYVCCNMHPEIPCSLMSYLNTVPLFVLHAYPDDIRLSSEYFKKI